MTALVCCSGPGDHSRYQQTNGHFHQKQQKQAFCGPREEVARWPAKKLDWLSIPHFRKVEITYVYFLFFFHCCLNVMAALVCCPGPRGPFTISKDKRPFSAKTATVFCFCGLRNVPVRTGSASCFFLFVLIPKRLTFVFKNQ